MSILQCPLLSNLEECEPIIFWRELSFRGCMLHTLIWHPDCHGHRSGLVRRAQEELACELSLNCCLVSLEVSSPRSSGEDLTRISKLEGNLASVVCLGNAVMCLMFSPERPLLSNLEERDQFRTPNSLVWSL